MNDEFLMFMSALRNALINHEEEALIWGIYGLLLILWK